MTTWTVRPVSLEEYAPWCRLFQGCAAFCGHPVDEEHQTLVWRWIHDERCVEALVALAVDESGNEVGEPQGLAHIRQWVRPLRGVVCGYLDDLFVNPSVRGTGAVDALFAEINRRAIERDWAIVRWTTAQDNYRAQAAYARLAVRTTWVTYDMTPSDQVSQASSLVVGRDGVAEVGHQAVGTSTIQR